MLLKIFVCHSFQEQKEINDETKFIQVRKTTKSLIHSKAVFIAPLSLWHFLTNNTLQFIFYMYIIYIYFEFKF